MFVVLTLACAAEDPEAGCLAPMEALAVTQAMEGSQPVDGAVKIVAPPAGQVYTGLYSIGGLEQALATSEEISGTSPALMFGFHDWAVNSSRRGPDLRDFESPLEEEILTPLEWIALGEEKGTTVALAWGILDYFVLRPGHWVGRDVRHLALEDLMDGAYDDFVRQAARQIRDAETPVMLSLWGEYAIAATGLYGEDGHTRMSKADTLCGAYGDPGLPDGPERVRDATRYVVDLFREEGVDNVTWFLYASTHYMNPESYDSPEHMAWEHPAYFYPGDDYVDWVGNSAYFSVDRGLRDVGDLDYALTAGQSAWAEVTDKPFFIPEFGASGKAGPERTALLGQVFEELPERGVGAFTMAEAPLFKRLYDLPMLELEADRALWAELSEQPEYLNDVVIEEAL